MMTEAEFFEQMSQISDFFFGNIQKIWDVIMGNMLLTLSFAITIISLCVFILNRIRHIK